MMIRTRSVTALLVAAVVLAACGRGAQDPASQLAAAFDATFSDPVAYAVSVDADAEALSSLGDELGQAAGILRSVTLSGTVDGDAATVAVGLLGSTVFEMRAIGDDRLYVRLGVKDLLAMFGGDGMADQLVGSLEQMGLDQDLRDVVTQGLEGRWIGVTGDLSATDLGSSDSSEPDDEEARAAVRDVLGPDLPAFFERYVTVDSEQEQDGVSTFEVSLELRELLRAAAQVGEDVGGDAAASMADLEADLEDLPQTVPGRITTRDGVVTELRFAVADTLREAGQDVAGTLDIVVTFSDHGDVEPVTAPEDALEISAEDIQNALSGLMGGGLGDLGGSGG